MKASDKIYTETNRIQAPIMHKHIYINQVGLFSTSACEFGLCTEFKLLGCAVFSN